jgi:O-antigen/teichoic acid export membrane protein
MSLIRKLAGQTAIYGLSTILGRFLNYLLVPLYTAVLADAADYGIVTQLFAYSGFVMVLFSYRMESAYFRFGTPIEQREKAYATGMGSLWVTSLFLSSCLFLFSEPIATALRLEDHPNFIRYFALIIGLDALCELPFARLRLEQKPLTFVAVKLTNIGINIGLNLFWLLFCPWASSQGWRWVHTVWTPEHPVQYIFLANLFASAATLIMLSPYLRVYRGRFDWPLLKDMIRYAAPLIVVSLAGIVNEMLDRSILIYLLPGDELANRAQLGIYGANYKLAMLISLFTQAYRYAAEPFFFRVSTEKDSPAVLAKAAEWFTLATSAAMLGILLFLPLIKHFLRNPAYHEGLGVVPILLLANVILGIYYNFSVWFRLKDKTQTGAWIALAGAVVTIVLNIALIPNMGYYGSAWATLGCYTLMAGLTWHLGRKHLPVPYPLSRMALYIAAALFAYTLDQLFSGYLPSWGQWAARTILMVSYLYAFTRKHLPVGTSRYA